MRRPYDPTLLLACTMDSPRRGPQSYLEQSAPRGPLLFCPLLTSWIWLGVQPPSSPPGSIPDPASHLLSSPDGRGPYETL